MYKIDLNCVLFDKKIEKEFNEKMQLYPKDHGDYGLLKSYDSLTGEEKIIYNAYFGDTGRNILMYILNPLLFIINIVLGIIIFLFIDLIRYAVNNSFRTAPYVRS